MTRSFLALIALLVWAAPLLAQDTRAAAPPQNSNDAQLRVVVVDTTDSAIPTAAVTITPTSGEPVTVMTDEHGVVTVPSLPVGQVRVRVEFAGFEQAEGTITLRRGANNQTVQLKLAGLSDEVTVTTSDVTSDTHGSAMISSGRTPSLRSTSSAPRSRSRPRIAT